MASILEWLPLILAGAAIFAVFAVLSLLADLLEWLLLPRNKRVK